METRSKMLVDAFKKREITWKDAYDALKVMGYNPDEVIAQLGQKPTPNTELSQVEFLAAYEGFGNLDADKLTANQADYAYHFRRPYVCVIHEKTLRGYYLDLNYNYLCSVEFIPRPGKRTIDEFALLARVVVHETETRHRAMSFTTPEWAKKLPVSDFTTYWLY